jgi:hypothetical protein
LVDIATSGHKALMSCKQNLWPRPFGGAKRK